MRQAMIERARSPEPWDVVILGGGATGLGTALDSALRGYRTLLLESRAQLLRSLILTRAPTAKALIFCAGRGSR